MKNKSLINFTTIWVGQMLSGLGSGITAFALGIFVYQQTGSATNFSLVTLCLFVPSVLLRPIGGVFADRFDRRIMIIIGDIGSATGIVFILASVLTGTVELWKIYSGVTVSSIFVALQSPAYKAIITDLLTEEQFSRAAGMVQLASSAQHLLSPLIAGLLLSLSSIKIVLMIDISTFLFAVLTVTAIKSSLHPVINKKENSISSDLKEGWAAITSNRGVYILILIISLISFFIGILQTLFGPMMLSFTDAATYGFSQSAGATGMLISSLILGIAGIQKNHVNILVTGLAIAGVCLSLMGMATSILFITGFFFLLFSALPLINTSADVLIRKNIPNEKQGRAWGIIGLLSQIGFIAAYSISGFLADHLFIPLLEKGGALAPTIGRITGTGHGRGIGLMLIISGLCMITVTAITFRITALRDLNNN